MDSSIIAVRVANGTFVPVMDTSGKTRRRLVLTTIRDQQTSVKIDLYRGSDEELGDAQYIGTLMIENIEPAEKGQADITLLVGTDEMGNLNATATDKNSGEYQSLSVSLDSDLAGGGYDVPDFELSDEELTLEDLSMDDDEIALDDSAASLSLDDVTLEEDLTMDVDEESATDTLAAPPQEEGPPVETVESIDDLELPDDDDLVLDDDELTIDEDELTLDDDDLTIDDDDLALPEEALAEAPGEPTAGGANLEAGEALEDEEVVGSEEEFESEETFAGLESFSDESVGLDASFAEEQLEEVDSEETAAEFATDDLPDLDDGLVEADLGDEDFTFDDGEEVGEDNLFETAESGGQSGHDAGLPEESDEGEFDETGFEEVASESHEEEISPDEFARLDSKPAAAASAVGYEADGEPLTPRRSNAIVFVGYLILSLAALGVLTYLVFRLLEGPPAPPLQAALPLLVSGFPLKRRGGRRKDTSNRR